MSSLGQRGSVGQKVSIAGFLDRVGHLGGVQLILVELNPNILVRDAIIMTKVFVEQPRLHRVC